MLSILTCNFIKKKIKCFDQNIKQHKQEIKPLSFIKQDYNAYESSNYPGYFIRHQNYRLKIDKDDGSDLFKKDASFFKESSEFF